MIPVIVGVLFCGLLLVWFGVLMQVLRPQPSVSLSQGDLSLAGALLVAFAVTLFCLLRFLDGGDRRFLVLSLHGGFVAALLLTTHSLLRMFLDAEGRQRIEAPLFSRREVKGGGTE